MVPCMIPYLYYTNNNNNWAIELKLNLKPTKTDPKNILEIYLELFFFDEFKNQLKNQLFNSIAEIGFRIKYNLTNCYPWIISQNQIEPKPIFFLPPYVEIHLLVELTFFQKHVKMFDLKQYKSTSSLF